MQLNPRLPVAAIFDPHFIEAAQKYFEKDPDGPLAHIATQIARCEQYGYHDDATPYQAAVALAAFFVTHEHASFDDKVDALTDIINDMDYDDYTALQKKLAEPVEAVSKPPVQISPEPSSIAPIAPQNVSRRRAIEKILFGVGVAGLGASYGFGKLAETQMETAETTRNEKEAEKLKKTAAVLKKAQTASYAAAVVGFMGKYAMGKLLNDTTDPSPAQTSPTREEVDTKDFDIDHEEVTADFFTAIDEFLRDAASKRRTEIQR